MRADSAHAQASLTVLDHLAGHRGSDEVVATLTTACDLAEKGRPTAEKVERLGAGCRHREPACGPPGGVPHRRSPRSSTRARARRHVGPRRR
ncbi:hypothetical protein ACN6K9_003541 [Streptomyces sp. SAS_267]|uniref:hypothetical protein n=1 Tax=unclassified Streptomyces TaxID=2593676 RepID=UPI0036F8B953